MAPRESFPLPITEVVLGGVNCALLSAVQQKEESNMLKVGGGWVEKCRKKNYEQTQTTWILDPYISTVKETSRVPVNSKGKQCGGKVRRVRSGHRQIPVQVLMGVLADCVTGVNSLTSLCRVPLLQNRGKDN